MKTLHDIEPPVSLMLAYARARYINLTTYTWEDRAGEIWYDDRTYWLRWDDARHYRTVAERWNAAGQPMGERGMAEEWRYA